MADKEKTDLEARGKAFLSDVKELEAKYGVALMATITKYGPRMEVIDKSGDKKDGA